MKDANPPARWTGRDGEQYDARFQANERAGMDVHGEARFVLGFQPKSVLDAGCGTGRVGIELARHGVRIVGVDLDQQMLKSALQKAPELDWRLGDLADLSVSDERGTLLKFDVVLAAGNVMIFVDSGREEAVVTNLARHLEPGGVLIAGFQLLPGRLDLESYDRWAAAAGLQLIERYATWDRKPFVTGGEYAVSVHRNEPLAIASMHP